MYTQNWLNLNRLLYSFPRSAYSTCMVSSLFLVSNGHSFLIWGILGLISGVFFTGRVALAANRNLYSLWSCANLFQKKKANASVACFVFPTDIPF